MRIASKLALVLILIVVLVISVGLVFAYLLLGANRLRGIEPRQP